MLPNQLKTALLLGLLGSLFLFVGYLIGGYQGLTIGLIFALGFNFITYWFSDRIVLALYGAKQAGKEEYYNLHRIVESVAQKAQLPKPRVYIINSPQANAFATGRNQKRAVVACTTGILNILDKDELEAVIGHEISHIKNSDILVGTIAAGIAAVISYVAFMARWAAIFGGFGRDDRDSNGLELIVLGILTPIIATLIQLAISRSREFLADESGAHITQKPLALASALEKIAGSVHHHPLAPHASTTATAHLFISNPFRNLGWLHLFSTHPSTADRVKRLKELKF
jgi:heat shock protein HtpX